MVEKQLVDYILAQNEIINDLINLIGCTLTDKRVPPDISLLAEKKLKPIYAKHSKLMEQVENMEE